MERWEADVRGALMEAEAMHWSTMCAQVCVCALRESPA